MSGLRGKKINTNKSALCFSPRTPRVLKEECCSVLDIKLVVCHERYLRLPTVIGRDKKKSRVLLIVFGRVQGWEEKIFSKGGKEILIKVVAQSIPTYTMSCFDCLLVLVRKLIDIWLGFSGKNWRKCYLLKEMRPNVQA